MDKYKKIFNLAFDIGAMLLTFISCAYFIYKAEGKAKIFPILIFIILVGYLIVNSKTLNTKINQKNNNSIECTLKKINSFINLSVEELKDKGITDIFSYINTLYDVISYKHILPPYLGLHKVNRIPLFDNPTLIANTISKLSNKNVEIYVSGEDSLTALGIKINDLKIALTPQKIFIINNDKEFDFTKENLDSFLN